jgi:hypothetical protein
VDAADARGRVEVRESARHAHDAVIAARGEAQAVGGVEQEFLLRKRSGRVRGMYRTSGSPQPESRVGLAAPTIWRRL